ncbi:MAG: bifunctional diaminohydroxyphosphoribosylaminopyrimidine deaminase/5-amino-6-(5-phosphoribosylamino)uracil reductase RibD [Acidimicrobiia bacterium]
MRDEASPERATGDDVELMARAVALGAGVRYRTPPNPWVGSVVVADGRIVGEGATEPPGGRHAEVLALATAGDRARGATVYATLEPCPHHGRTSPCAEALIEAGVERVVVAVADPDPRVAGRGIERLRAAGITVDVGVGADAVVDDLAPYLHHRSTGRAFCLMKSAMSLDGRVTAAAGASRWITGEQARAAAHGLRADSQAVVVGSGTALADEPALTVRLAGGAMEPPHDPPRQPVRVLLDARGRVPASGPLFDPALAPTLVVTTDAAPATATDGWRSAGAKVEVLDPSAAGGVDLPAVLELLGREGVLQAMFEGGPTVHGALLSQDLPDRIVAYLANTVLGPGGRPAFDGGLPAALGDAPRLRLRSARPLGDDVRLEYAERR